MPSNVLTASRSVALALFLVACFSSLSCMAWPQQVPPKTFADTILTNAHVWTVDDRKPEAEAIAIVGAKILFVGSSTEALAYQGPSTKVLDLHGARVLPGFNDAHTHFENATQWFFEARLVDVNTESEMLQRVREAAQRVPAGMWITAIDMSGNAAWTQKANDASFKPLEPVLADVDATAGDHPVLLKRYEGASFINTRGMELIHLNPEMPDPAGGHYGRGATGRLNGMQYGKAAQITSAIVPSPTMAVKLIAARGVESQMNAFGITSIHDIARLDAISQLQIYMVDIERSYSDVDIFRDLEKRGELTVRVYAYQPLRSWSQLAQFGLTPGSGDEFVRFGILKDFVDGGWMQEPYTNRPNYQGGVTFRFTTDSEERSWIDSADQAGYDLGFHTIGDKALSTLLGWYSEALRLNGPRSDRRDCVIHMWYAKPGEIRQAGAMHLIADVTPAQLLDDPDAVTRQFGPERARTAFAWRSMIDAGMRVDLVSDMPCLYSRMKASPYNPLENMYYAITRQNADGLPAGGWHSEQCMTLKEAVAAYTINPAFASHEENIKGSITAGKLADIVVLSEDIFAVKPAELLKTKVTMTMLGGKVVYQAK
jgi:predicted amidohydrolase YtcJ